MSNTYKPYDECSVLVRGYFDSVEEYMMRHYDDFESGVTNIMTDAEDDLSAEEMKDLEALVDNM